MSRLFLIVSSILVLSIHVKAQDNPVDTLIRISPQDSLDLIYDGLFSLNEIAAFQAYEDTMNQFSEILFTDPDEKTRKLASHNMIFTLKAALNQPNSFHYGFEGMTAVSIIQPEDAKFRIFTWQFTFNNNTYRYFGAIQMNTEELTIYPLVDYSVVMGDVDRLVTDNERWLGALYYGVKKFNDGERDYYVLFGYDGNNAFSTKKLADVLWFTDSGEIRFGAPLFYVPAEKEGEEDPQPLFRYILEYKKGVTATIRYTDEFDKIMYDNLIPINDQSEGMYFNYVPDGSYQGFIWKKDRFEHVDKVFDFKLEDGEFPDGN